MILDWEWISNFTNYPEHPFKVSEPHDLGFLVVRGRQIAAQVTVDGEDNKGDCEIAINLCKLRYGDTEEGKEGYATAIAAGKEGYATAIAAGKEGYADGNNRMAVDA